MSSPVLHSKGVTASNKPLIERLSGLSFQVCVHGEEHNALSKICLDNVHCRNNDKFFEAICETCDIEEAHGTQRDQHKTEDLKLFLIKLCQLAYRTDSAEL